MLISNSNTNIYGTPKQLKLPLDLGKIIDISDPVYTLSEVIDHIDLRMFFAEEDCKMGRPKCDQEKMLKVILFAFMENGYCSLRTIEKLCKTDIRYMWLLDDMPVPTFVTFGNFIRNELSVSIDAIFTSVNKYIFEKEKVDLSHVYIDGTKIIANANRYSWVWKKSCTTNRDKVFLNVSSLLEDMNKDIMSLGVCFEKRSEYAIEYLEQILERYREVLNIDTNAFVSGSGHRKSTYQRKYQKLEEYIDRLKRYAKSIEICGDARNSYSKTDNGATFMRIKTDYMGNDQLLPAYNMQIGICDEYIAVVDARQYASDMDCFAPLMDKFKDIYGNYPEYPVADAGYGSYNNYLYCEEHGMKKYMKFTMYKKETEDKKYQSDPYRAVNFKKGEDGLLICPNGKKFVFKESRPVRGNRYGRTEDIYECENCEGCPFKQECAPKAAKNRTIRMNIELTSIHNEVIDNLNSVHGALLRMNRSIQAEGAYGVMKWDRSYTRAYRRGTENVDLELKMISIGFNLYKYHNKRKRQPDMSLVA
jgi:transposase